MSYFDCLVCGSDDENILDAKDCIQCKRTVCTGCIQWYGCDHDEPNGEWFCDDCIDGGPQRPQPGKDGK